MVICRNWNLMMPAFPLLLSDTPLQKVEIFKYNYNYLGLMLSADFFE